jgi:hypothetical protein
MNDATEFGLALGMFQDRLKGIGASTSHTAERSAAETLRMSLFGLEVINIFAACFCESGDLLSQWRGYSGGAQGYAIAFKTFDVLQIANLSGFTLGRCIYDADVQRKIVQEAVRHCLEYEMSLTSETHLDSHNPLAEILFRCGALFKDASFKDEKEWRLVSSIVRYGAEQIGFRPAKSMITPHYRIPIRFGDGVPIDFVVVGPCPHMQLAQSAVTSLLMRYGNLSSLRGKHVTFASTVPFRDW